MKLKDILNFEIDWMLHFCMTLTPFLFNMIYYIRAWMASNFSLIDMIANDGSRKTECCYAQVDIEMFA